MIYLDTAAVVKLVCEERETAALVEWLNNRIDQSLVSSALIEVELPRALRRSSPGVLGAVAGVLARLHRADINAAVRATVAAYADPMLRSLDAIHLATAELLVASDKKITAFVTYDKRLATAAVGLGLPVAAPGEAQA
ncbi:type II toxin-antitoxin system VapC family toxin [Lentzea nigeriaca]|uniref:type II toxin-antitoxin system VapC family toxin n=1 Tax=Lentzea nigeriaca TaxID=1128665 RepID=UPI0019598072|nr:type II toxin-antitoxin system VapC family toxin [Lentzea nigeriaca]MBM7858043.1 putative nucleic acid-binding protein [Lentzea nigeriaca]